MSKNDAMASFYDRYFHRNGEIFGENFNGKKDTKRVIREIADDDECFENIVFELGCNVLAKAIAKDIRGE